MATTPDVDEFGTKCIQRCGPLSRTGPGGVPVRTLWYVLDDSRTMVGRLRCDPSTWQGKPRVARRQPSRIAGDSLRCVL